ncbi:DUF1415 domain-containing protein [Aquincola sp. S2]|uniref:DUF1415 domain-containing protein n=1 Tax=Pseudaquabacterium terrae TaxID=2732868 RepID=A0ABX2EJQ7_9BURK|nr:DUF1415 domain-containing protein [Aquabacterium terrae]NRF68855.1 DUF1415 domain-containing protein [Aquabacterium terrae]
MNAPNVPSDEAVIASTRAWLEHAVIGLNLCPFAKAVHAKGQIRYVVSDATDVQALQVELVEQLRELVLADPDEVDTTLLIHPQVLQDFDDFNQFLGLAEEAVQALGLEGVLQVASFHPQFQFADAEPDDIGNATNRAPYPILHLLREDSIDRAVEAFPEAEAIYEVNIETMQRLGPEGWAALQKRWNGEPLSADAAAPAPRSDSS